jgi:hypothetical protein
MTRIPAGTHGKNCNVEPADALKNLARLASEPGDFRGIRIGSLFELSEDHERRRAATLLGNH